jgi:hypothetical protein
VASASRERERVAEGGPAGHGDFGTGQQTEFQQAPPERSLAAHRFYGHLTTRCDLDQRHAIFGVAQVKTKVNFNL